MTNKYRSRRIANEWTEIQRDYKDIRMSQDTSRLVWDSPHGRTYVLDIPQEYPFKPLVVYENGIPYTKKEFAPWQLRLYEKLHGRCGCTCCIFPASDSRWGPCITIRHIIDFLAQEESKWIDVYVLVIDQFAPNVDIALRIAEFM